MSTTRLLDHWMPPDGAGDPVACLATTFTFEADFFAQDCLSRFLRLSSVVDGDGPASVATLLEEEDRLSETQVSVVVDRSTPAEKRNLRWDVLEVAVPGGLLHAKVAVLVWQRAARVLVGSANLTSAGYRRQVELCVALDLDERCRVPRSVLDDLLTELRRVVGLVPGPRAGPVERALATVDLLATRVSDLVLPRAQGRGLRLAVAPARPGRSPLERLGDVWSGAQPLTATALSPFWDGETPPPALGAIRRRLTGRPAARRRMTLVVGLDPVNGSVQAPVSLASAGAAVVAFDPPDDAPRSLHAKLLLYESEDWVAALVGSSNMTEAGLGLHPARGHVELNVWLGCPAGSPAAKHLRALARAGRPVSMAEDMVAPAPDEDEPLVPPLPLGFVTCLADAAPPPRALLWFDPERLPDDWDVRTTTGRLLLTSAAWRAAGRARECAVDLPDEPLPAYLDVRWTQGGEPVRATWTVNVRDRSALPPPAELSALPVEVLLAALASTRPLPLALERELRRRQRVPAGGDAIDLDPLRRFDGSGLLLQRTRRLSLALWRLQERLGRPASSPDALRWRLHGVVGPLAIADGVVAAAREEHALPGEAQFVLAELALTLARVDWTAVAAGRVEPAHVRAAVDGVLSAIEERMGVLGEPASGGLAAYVEEALREARR